MTDLSLPVDEDDVLLCCLLVSAPLRVTILGAVSHLKQSYQEEILTRLTSSCTWYMVWAAPGPPVSPHRSGGVSITFISQKEFWSS